MGNTKKQLKKRFNKKTFLLMSKVIGFARFKIVKHSVPQLKPDALNATFIPINKEIELPSSEVIPLTLLYNIIEKASHRVIVDFCPCRTAMDCQHYSKDIGCLMMGRGALDIDPSMGHEVSVEEARKHVEKAVKDGLVPLVGKSLVENMIFGISRANKDKFFVACFCCDCCCVSRFFKPLPPELRKENLIKMDGMVVSVGNECTGCGDCSRKCFMEAIKIENGKAVIGDGCLGCGRCAIICPNSAIKITITEDKYIEEVQKRLERYVDIN